MKFKKEEDKFFTELINYLNNGIAPKGNQFVILKTPDIMQYANIPNNEIILSTRIVNKAKKIHGLTDEEIITALSQLADPVLIFDSDNTSENKLPSILAFTNTFNSEIKPVSISLNYDEEKQLSNIKIIINDITSIYDRNLNYLNKENQAEENLIDKWTNKGLCRYVNDKKISDWQESTRVQFSLEPFQSDKNNIKTYSGFVNSKNTVESTLEEYKTRHEKKCSEFEELLDISSLTTTLSTLQFLANQNQETVIGKKWKLCRYLKSTASMLIQNLNCLDLPFSEGDTPIYNWPFFTASIVSLVGIKF